MQRSRVTVFGAGGIATLIVDLVRSGLGAVDLVDPQIIEPSNIARQDHMTDQIGTYKVDALRNHVKRLNPEVDVRTFPMDACTLTDDDVMRLFSETNLFIFATDSFRAQSRGNQIALQLRKPALWSGLYAGAGAGEVLFWYEGLPCHQCVCQNRYKAHAAGQASDPVSDGATIFDIHYLDAITGMLAVGLLTRGTDHRFGRLIDQLGDRNFMQIKLDPTWTWNGRDLFREQLGIPLDCEAYFSFTAIARRDPDGGEPPCPDCVKYLGRRPRPVPEKGPVTV